MSNTPIITQSIAKLDLSFKNGDAFAMTITFPSSVADHTIVAQIGGDNFTITRSTDKIIILKLTEIQTANIINGTIWDIKLTKDDVTRTYISGEYIKI